MDPVTHLMKYRPKVSTIYIFNKLVYIGKYTLPDSNDIHRFESYMKSQQTTIKNCTDR